METLEEAYYHTYHKLPSYVPKEEFKITPPKVFGMGMGRKKGKHKK